MGLIEKLEQIKTLVENGAGGGSGEDLVIEDCRYLFFSAYRLDMIQNLYKIIKPTSANYMFGATANTTSNATLEQLNYISKIDFSNCTTIDSLFRAMSYTNFPSELVLDLPKCTIASNFLYGYAGTYNLKRVILKNTNLVQNWSYAFYTGFNNTGDRYQKKIEEIELDMSACTNCTYFFNSPTATLSNCMYLTKIVFTGSFGGNSTTSTLTLDMSKLEGMTKDGFVAMFESLGENTNGKTRIIQISAAIYDTMSEDELSIATDKGYTITSA